MVCPICLKNNYHFLSLDNRLSHFCKLVNLKLVERCWIFSSLSLKHWLQSELLRESLANAPPAPRAPSAFKPAAPLSRGWTWISAILRREIQYVSFFSIYLFFLFYFKITKYDQSKFFRILEAEKLHDQAFDKIWQLVEKAGNY